MDTDTPPAVRLTGLTKTFGDVRAVDGIDLTIEPGEVVAFLGPNGAGKTTTVDMMLGLSRPTSGTVEIFGGDARKAVALGRVAAVMQTGGLLRDFTIREIVELTASLFRPSRPVDEVLERAGLTEVSDRLVHKASGGQQQRLRFAMALLPDPDLLVLDEPTTGMDVQGRRDFWGSIREDARRGRTTIFATHYLEEADAYADRIVLVRRGRIVADGTASQIKAMASGRMVRATWEGADARALADLDGVESVDVRGDTVVVHGKDSDAVARFLLSRTPARDLEISAHNLEDAFVALTADSTSTEGVNA
ncbi:MAG: ABC transporter ATP-binding protein [Actinomycetales bacterium]|nr:MAG: ABC transporter ATP-binding protein [Actinomycetales bacterium]